MYAITSTSSSLALEAMAEMATVSLNHCPACCSRSVLLLSFVKIALSFLNLVSTRHNRCLKELSWKSRMSLIESLHVQSEVLTLMV
jgi:hypothetical protein